MNNRGPGRRGWGPWIAAGILVVLLAGFDQGGVLIALALLAAVLGLVLLAWRSQRRRGVGMMAAALVALLVGGLVLGADQPTSPSATPTSYTSTPPSTPTASANSPTATPSTRSDQGRETPSSSAPATTPSSDASTQAPSPTPTHADADPGRARSAVGVLALLEIKGRAPKTGYDRDAFAYRAVDLDHNGCDTRNDVLNRDLQATTHRPGTSGCVVLTGMLDDPYSGDWISFVRGVGTSNDVQIDHVVALSDAWQKGAQAWEASTLQAFGNDPLNLLAVSGPLNAQKRDGDAATWLPPNRSYRCAYVARQIAVKHAYDLWLTQAEHDAMARILTACPDQVLPVADDPAQPPASNVPTPPPAEPATQAPPADAPDEPYYANCTEVRAAGADPIRPGDPGWSTRFDGDGDGVGCE